MTADEGNEMQMQMHQSSTETFVQAFEGCSEAFAGGKSFMDNFRQEEHAAERRANLYFPFASREEWQLASWILRSRLSLSAIDSLLSLDIVSVFLRSRERDCESICR